LRQHNILQQHLSRWADRFMVYRMKVQAAISFANATYLRKHFHHKMQPSALRPSFNEVQRIKNKAD